MAGSFIELSQGLVASSARMRIVEKSRGFQIRFFKDQYPKRLIVFLNSLTALIHRTHARGTKAVVTVQPCSEIDSMCSRWQEKVTKSTYLRDAIDPRGKGFDEGL